MLGVGLRKLCPQDSFGYAFREKKTVRKSTPGGCKTGPREVQHGLRTRVDPNLAAKAARKLCLGRSGGAWDACDALGTVLGASWGVPGLSWAALGGRFGTFQGLIQTIWTRREIQQKRRILRCFWASRASRRAPKAIQNRPGKPLGRLLGPKIGLEGPS